MGWRCRDECEFADGGKAVEVGAGEYGQKGEETRHLQDGGASPLHTRGSQSEEWAKGVKCKFNIYLKYKTFL